MSLFLSQMRLRHAEALADGLRDDYQWHRFVWKAFPGRADDARPFLFRVDVDDGIVRVLLLSDAAPRPVDGRAWETKTVSDGFLSHAAYRFQVRANPTFRRSADHRRLALFREEDLRVWIERKLADAGCELRQVEIDAPQRRAFSQGGRRGIHCTVDFRGVLAVRDATALAIAFANGIGSGKGFGYGLLMLRPVDC